MKDTYQDIELCNVVGDKTVILKNQHRIVLDEPNRFLYTCLLTIIRKDKKSELNVLDFGGACGAHYFQIRRYLPATRFRWIIVETEQMINAAKIRKLGNCELTFISNMSVLPILDVVHCSACLEYTLKPYEVLSELLYRKPKYFILNRLHFGEVDGVLEIQKSKLSHNGVGPLPTDYTDKIIQYPRVLMTKETLFKIMNKDYKILISQEDKLFYGLK